MSARFLWEINDLRRRMHDRVLGEPGCSSPSAGERFGRAPSGPAGEPSRGAWYPDRFADHVFDPPGLQRGMRPQEQFRGAGHLGPIARRLDDLARELDQRHNDARESGRAAIKSLTISMAPRRDEYHSQERDRVCVETDALERDQQFAREFDRWVASRNRERDELGSSADHFAFSTFDPVQPPASPARHTDRIDTRSSQSASTPFASAGLEAISPIVKPELLLGARYTDRISDDVGNPAELRRGLERQEEEFEAIEHLNSIARRLDELTRELDERESDATDAEIAAFKHRLTVLSDEIDQQRVSPTALNEADECSDTRAGQLVSRAVRTGEGGNFGEVGSFGSPVMPLDQRRSEALAAGLAAINALVNSMVPRRDPHQNQMPGRVLSECIETDALERDQQFAAVPVRWTASDNRERDHTGSPNDPFMISASDRLLPPISSAHRTGAVNKRPLRSTMAPFAKAVLAAVLAITVLVTGTYFVRSRLPGTSPATLVAAIFREKAPAGDASASRPLGIAPQNTFARFQEQVFQLPSLYGIYAINNGKLFELETLPGQVPDRRVPVSAVVPQPSRTTLPDGRVAFLVFRRDVATNISERVPIRIVAKIKRKMTLNPAGDRRSVGMEDAWTIRNIAFDFRVAPVEQNREMVLLRPEDSAFTFPPGRYALILKGQGYDFTVAGPITDPAQCLERIEAANGNFFHECQQPDAGTAGPPLLKSAPPQRSRLSSKNGRRGEIHARADD